MKTMDFRVAIVSLYRQKKTKKEIARELGVSKNTVKKYIQAYEKNNQNEFYKTTIDRKSSVENHQEQIIEWINETPDLSYLRIWEKLKEEKEFLGGYDSVRRFCQNLKKSQNVFPTFNYSKPGKEAQVDFGYIGLLYDPITNKNKKAYVFCMRLMYSRYDYYEVVFSQKVKDFIQCHQNAFKYFGGVPYEIKIDNLKAAILEAHFYSPVYQKEYLAFSKHYGFVPIACRPYRPKDKASVENGIKYVKKNFFAGRKFKDIHDCQNQLISWTKEKSLRQHGTTRKAPKNDFLNIEKAKLHPLPKEPFELVDWSIHKLHPDCYLRVDQSFYSAPFKYVGKKLSIRKTNAFVEIYDENLNWVYTHKKTSKKWQKSKDSAHFPEWVDLISSSLYQYHLKRAEKYGEEVKRFCEKVFSEHKSSGYAMIQGILYLGKQYGNKRLEEACVRSKKFENYTYRSIKNILTKNLISQKDFWDQESPESNEPPEDNSFGVDLKKYDHLYH